MSPARLFACLLLLVSTATAGAAVNQLLEKLRSDYAALVAAEHDFHSRRERQGLEKFACMVRKKIYWASPF